MSSLLKQYLTKTRQYARWQQELHKTLEEIITLKPVTTYSFNFSPTQSSILAQIKHWPAGEFNLPPAAWVQPQKGQIELDAIWEFAFHGAGLSFVNPQTNQDISIEYTQTGELGMTHWTVKSYLQTLPATSSQLTNVLAEHDNLFAQTIHLGYLTKAPPFLGEGKDDQTYICSAKMDEIGQFAN